MSKHLKTEDNSKTDRSSKIEIELDDDFDEFDFDEEEMTDDIEEDKSERSSIKVKRIKEKGKKKKGWLIGLIVAAVICAAVFLGAYAVSKSDKNLPNVYIAGIDVSRLTKEQTREKLTAENWDTRTATAMKLSLLNIMDVDIDPIESGFILSKEEAVEKAFKYGHDGNIFENLIKYIKGFFNRVDINTVNTSANNNYLDTKLMEGFDGLHELFGIDEFHEDIENEIITTRKGWGQIDFDKEDIKTQIGNAIRNGDKELIYMTLTKEVTMPDFNALNDKLPKESKNASYTDDGKFDVIDETVAAEFDVEAAKEIWTNTQIGQTVKIPITVTKPETTGEGLRSQLFRDLLGAMSTRYTNSIENRCSNVRLCASKINEHIVYPGEVFSYNEVVGKRTEEAGFLPAPAYVGLDAEETVKDEIGGGCCQVSSTLYAATLFGFLETVERSCHIYPVNYMMLGIDATVTIPDGGQEIDFKFKNNKNYPIKIVAYNEENETEKKVTVEIWGTLEDDDYMPVEFDARYSWTQDYDRFIEKADPNREGYTIKLDIDRYTDAGAHGTLTSTQTLRKVFNSAGEQVEEQITNLPNPATGQPSMDQYNQH